MKVFLFICLLQFIVSSLVAQDVIIFADNSTGKAALHSLSGEKSSLLTQLHLLTITLKIKEEINKEI